MDSLKDMASATEDSIDDAGRATTPVIGVVIPVHDEEKNIEPLYERLVAQLKKLDARYAIVFADDGSRDATPRLIRKIRKRDPRVGTVRLSRNFGHQCALMAGLDRIDTDVIVAMDGDLQHPPELIPELLAAWRGGADVVQTRRRDHESTGFVKKLTSRCFYSLLRRMTEVQIEIGTADFFLIDRSVGKALRECHESSRFHRGLLPWLGFERSYVEYEAEARNAGASKYTVRKMLKLAMDGICGFSVVPLRISGVIGLCSVLLSAAYMIFAIVSKLTDSDIDPGWTSLVSIITFLAGMQLMILWVHGEYLARVFMETRQRPVYVVSEERLPETDAGAGPDHSTNA